MKVKTAGRRVIGKMGEEIVVETLQNNAKAKGIRLQFKRIAPFSGDDENRFHGSLHSYDGYIQFDVGTNGFSEKREYLIEIKSLFDYQPKKEMRISIPQFNRYDAISFENNIEYLFFFVDFQARYIYRTSRKAFKRLSSIKGNYYCISVNDLEVYDTIDDVVVDDLSADIEVAEFNSMSLFGYPGE